MANVCELVAPHGYLVITDKFVGLEKPLQEQDIVRRRPLAWYLHIASALGLRLLRTVPMMWCADPPTQYGGPRAMRLISRAAWVAVRAPLKWTPCNSPLQQVLGRILGASVAAVDQLVLPRLDSVPNLMSAVFKREL
jgi:hypothetical protein